MSRYLHLLRGNFFKALLVLTMAALGTAADATADRVEVDPFYSKLQKIWSKVLLDRNLDYWRAPESTPGSFLSIEPAATNVWVSCDRWPDGSDARRFGLDAIRLSGAQTDHEKALAVYRWVRRWMIYNNKKGSSIEHLNLSPVGHAVVQQADKLLNVYGVHWCAGQARVVEQIWRAVGYRAEKVVRGGHTIVGLHYQDYDGVSRWHGLDVSHSAVAWHDSYRRLLSLDELSTQWYAYFYQYGLPGNGHIYFNDHRMELQLRHGETLERLWGNLGRPYQDNAASGPGMADRVPDSERGPYLPFAYGNGIWSYKPDLRLPGWEKGLAEKPVNMNAGKLQPAAALKPAAAIWHFRTPYIISDASVRLVFKRKDASDKIRLLFSADNGRSWAPIWQCPDNLVGMQDMLIPICPKYDVSEKGQPPPPNFHSPFGRYSYRLKLELNAGKSPENFQVSDIAFENTVQLNLYSLPQLHPGINKISVSGKIAPALALRITYIWADAAGRERRHVALVENTPFAYEIIVDGEKWTDCVCKSIKVEAVDATGKGNSLEHVEGSRKFKQADVLPPVEETTGRWNGQPLRKTLPRLEDVISATRDPQRFRRMLRGAVMLADPRMFDAFKNLAYQEPSPNDKLLAFVGMYRADSRKARPVLLDILNDREGRRVVWSNGKDSSDIGWGRELSWCEAGTVIGYIAAEAQWPEFLPDLLRVLSSDQCKSGWGPRYGTVRVIGQLGQGNREAIDAIRNILEQKHGKEHGDTLVAAALAAGLLADKSAISSLRRHLAGEYWPLKHNAALALGKLGDRSIVPRMQHWLKAPFDENFRGCAAEVLGDLHDGDAVMHLENALAVEPVPWVRQKIEESLKRIQTVTHNEN